MIDLEKIEDPSFVKDLSIKELKELASQIRNFLVDSISKTGGHLASNLGIVELTLALYYVFDFKKDKFIFDVGHQSYVHKILTGRAKEFSTLRKYGGLSGYIKSSESEYDVWESGHSSTSISAMSGFLLAQRGKPDAGRVLGIIGDCAVANGLAFEGLNFLGSLNERPIIILNDNKMGISKSVGAMSKLFNRLRKTGFYRGLKRTANIILPNFITNWFHRVKRSIKAFFELDNVFENLGFDYYGPINGNDIKSLIVNFKRIQKANGAIVVHTITKKGYGYSYAENDEFGSYHGTSPFDKETGKPINCNNGTKKSYSEIVSATLVHLRKEYEFSVVTPGMKVGAQLEEFAKLYPNDFLDVGIMESHAATMSAGMAKNGKSVVLLMYSTFAQRAYDNILNDICRQGLKIIIGIDRAGVVGEDGSTHQGIYDVSMFNAMPNIAIAMPKNGMEAAALFRYAMTYPKTIVIRYPKGGDYFDSNAPVKEITSSDWEIIKDGKKAVVISYGNDLDKITSVIKDNNLDVALINARFIRPVDEKMLKEIFERKVPILVIEQAVQIGALFSNIIYYASKNNIKCPNVSTLGFEPDDIIEHGDLEIVLNHNGFSKENILAKIKGLYEN